MSSSSTPFVYDGNLLCLDLVNTRMVVDGDPVDTLRDYDALVTWFVGAGLVSDREARELSETWARTDEAPTALHGALRLRDAARDIADAILAKEEAPEEALDVVNATLARHATVQRVVPGPEGLRLESRPVETGPAWPLGAVAESAARLLTELDGARVSRCDDPACVLYFYDTSKNRSRRWCSMERCGNRAKVSRYRERERR